MGSSTATHASRNNGISARQSPAAFRITYPHGRCPGLGCHGVCGGECRPEKNVRCHCQSSNEGLLPRLCVHCKANAAIRDRAVQRLERVQQQHHHQAIAAEYISLSFFSAGHRTRPAPFLPQPRSHSSAGPFCFCSRHCRCLYCFDIRLCCRLNSRANQFELYSTLYS